MSKENRENYQLGNLDLYQLNFVLNRLADRLDALEGRRGTPVFKSNVEMETNKIRTLGNAAIGTDAPTLSQVEDNDDYLQVQITALKAIVDSHVANMANPHVTTLELARVAGSTFSGEVSWTDGGMVIQKIS